MVAVGLASYYYGSRVLLDPVVLLHINFASWFCSISRFYFWHPCLIIYFASLPLSFICCDLSCISMVPLLCPLHVSALFVFPPCVSLAPSLCVPLLPLHVGPHKLIQCFGHCASGSILLLSLLLAEGLFPLPPLLLFDIWILPVAPGFCLVLP